MKRLLLSGVAAADVETRAGADRAQSVGRWHNLPVGAHEKSDGLAPHSS